MYVCQCVCVSVCVCQCVCVCVCVPMWRRTVCVSDSVYERADAAAARIGSWHATNLAARDSHWGSVGADEPPAAAGPAE